MKTIVEKGASFYLFHGSAYLLGGHICMDMTSSCRIITSFHQKIGFKIIFSTIVSGFSGQ